MAEKPEDSDDRTTRERILEYLDPSESGEILHSSKEVANGIDPSVSRARAHQILRDFEDEGKVVSKKKGQARLWMLPDFEVEVQGGMVLAQSLTAKSISKGLITVGLVVLTIIHLTAVFRLMSDIFPLPSSINALALLLVWIGWLMYVDDGLLASKIEFGSNATREIGGSK